MYDLAIIGSGPAGLTAGIYAERAKLNTIVLEKNYISGGQITSTYEVDNYPALPGISGMKLAQEMRSHAEKLGVSFKTTSVNTVEDKGKIKILHTSDGDIEAKSIIIATGAGHSKLGIPGEEEFTGRGVSYCATCDGAFFRNKEVVVVGGGNVAVEDAIFLARASSKVYVVHRRDELRAEKILQEELLSLPNVEMVWSSVATEVVSENNKVTGLKVKNVRTGEERVLQAKGIFIAVGIVPHSQVFTGLVDMDEKGYIKADETGRTSVPGIFAAGDVRTKQLRQIVTAVSDGANAVSSVQDYLLKLPS